MDAKARILQLARAEGFALASVARAEAHPQARAAALDALGAGRLAAMGWITAPWIERATDPQTFLPGARSIVLVALPYGADSAPVEDGEKGTGARGRVARYAQGRDYHRVFEKKLRRIAAAVREQFAAEVRVTVDYGPLLERPLAVRAGLGWAGKSTMLLAPGFGPWLLLGAIATTLELQPGPPLRKTCGSCTRCIVACPTGALSPEGHVLDARRCISYHTIENRGAIPRELRAMFGDWVFGCDACLDACPVGARSRTSSPDLAPGALDDASPALAAVLALDEPAFRERYRGRPILRAKRDGFVRNACVALGNVGAEADLPALAGALNDASPLVRGHAAWALGRLAERLPRTRTAVLAMLVKRRGIEDEPGVREEILLAIHATGTLPEH